MEMIFGCMKTAYGVYSYQAYVWRFFSGRVQDVVLYIEVVKQFIVVYNGSMKGQAITINYHIIGLNNGT